MNETKKQKTKYATLNEIEFSSRVTPVSIAKFELSDGTVLTWVNDKAEKLQVGRDYLLAYVGNTVTEIKIF